MACLDSYSDYGPSDTEVRCRHLCAILDELDGKKIIDSADYEKQSYSYYNDIRFYNKINTAIHELTREVCSRLQEVKDLSKYSLEIQLWWKNHQRRDKERIEKELEEQKRKQDKQNLLNRLSDYEKTLLGIR